ncbi:MAG: DNA-3-methyladenine glycosylase 2 family protein [Clostridia bacterium]|nr:DNA-3-methyladenine glycosylase 2 family protein [Clostridia bacterium]
MKNYVEIKGYDKDFIPKHIFECGQCFRFKKEKDDSFTIVAKGKVINVSKRDGNIILKNTTDEDVADIWFDYFDLGTDYIAIKNALSVDKHLKKSVVFGSGIRILNQDLWECIISFIISANNNIPRIQGIVEKLCERYGDKISAFDNTYYTFPDADRLKDVTKEELAFLRAGYRDSYLLDAIKKVADREIELNKLSDLSTQEAKSELLKIKGVGNKVADCILLFGNKRCETFPVDVWVKRSISTIYAGEIGDMEISDFAAKKFGGFAGYAQQYLFYYMRENS